MYLAITAATITIADLISLIIHKSIELQTKTFLIQLLNIIQ